jgi:membrane protease YdiL (CAAX protease family)
MSMPTNAIQLVAPILLAFTVLSLWVGSRAAWPIFLTLTFLAGCAAGQLTWLSGLWTLLLAGACYAYAKELPRSSKWLVGSVKAAGLAGIVILSVAMGFHALPGFHNIHALSATRLSSRSIPYDQWIDFDKTIAGVLILGIVYRRLIKETSRWVAALRRAAIPAVVTIVLVVLLSAAFGYVQWDPKWTSQFWLWAAINLLATCTSEEAFFRAFILAEIERLFARRPAGAIIAIASSSLLFGIAHAAGGWQYVTLAIVAGAGYGMVFYRSQSVEGSILAHFALNAVHFLLFTYPAAALR